MSQSIGWTLTLDKIAALEIDGFDPAEWGKLAILVVKSAFQCEWGQCWLHDDSIVRAIGGRLRGWKSLERKAIEEGLLLVRVDAKQRAGRVLIFSQWFLGESAERTSREEIEASLDALEQLRTGEEAGPEKTQNREYSALRRFKQIYEARFSRRLTPAEAQAFLSGRRQHEAEGRERGLSGEKLKRHLREYFEASFAALGVIVTEDACDTKEDTSATQTEVVSQEPPDTSCDTLHNVVVVSKTENLKPNNNNIMSRETVSQDLVSQPATQNGRTLYTPPETGVPEPFPNDEEITALLAVLRPHEVTEQVVIRDLVPKYGYRRCLKQANWLAYRDEEVENLAAGYTVSVRDDWARPAKYRKAQAEQAKKAHRAEDEAKAREMVETRRKEREAQVEQEKSLGQKMGNFKDGLSPGYRVYLEDCVLAQYKISFPGVSPSTPLKKPIEHRILEDWMKELPALPDDYKVEVQIPDIPEQGL